MEKYRGLAVEVLRMILRVSDLAPQFMKLCQINNVASKSDLIRQVNQVEMYKFTNPQSFVFIIS